MRDFRGARGAEPRHTLSSALIVATREADEKEAKAKARRSLIKPVE